MLIGARNAGFDISGNIEWRRYYSLPDKEGRVTFLENFPGAIHGYKLADMDRDQVFHRGPIDLAMGHPECGHASQLNTTNKNHDKHIQGESDIRLFVEMVSQLKPNYVVMDDLPKSFIGFEPEKYHELLPDYDLFFEWICNYGYGNVQKHRNRLFLIAAKRELEYVFVPGEKNHSTTLEDLIGDLVPEETLGTIPNHLPHDMAALTGRANHLFYRGFKGDWRDISLALQWQRIGTNLDYVGTDGEIHRRVCNLATYWDRHTHLLTGANPIYHPILYRPLTIRERARIQGFPDDFIFYSERVNDRGEWNHDKNSHMTKMTGKAMPIQFNQYVASHIKHHIETGNTNPEFATGNRILKPNSYVDEAKQWYCHNVGYSDQKRACEACWMKPTCDLPRNPDTKPVSVAVSEPQLESFLGL